MFKFVLKPSQDQGQGLGVDAIVCSSHRIGL